MKDGETIEEEESEEEEPIKKKGKVVIAKPTKPSNDVFSRRSSRKKPNKEGEDVIFKSTHPPLRKE